MTIAELTRRAFPPEYIARKLYEEMMASQKLVKAMEANKKREERK